MGEFYGLVPSGEHQREICPVAMRTAEISFPGQGARPAALIEVSGSLTRDPARRSTTEYLGRLNGSLHGIHFVHKGVSVAWCNGDHYA